MKTLRQRIRKTGIKVVWKFYKNEIVRLPISAQTLFMNRGLPFDTFEIELKKEGWLSRSENLFDVLFSDLYRELDPVIKNEFPFDDSWTEEDYKFFYNKEV